MRESHLLEAEALVAEAEAVTQCWENGIFSADQAEESMLLLDRLTEFVGEGIYEGDLDDEALSRMLEITNKLSRVSLRYTDNSAGPLAKAGRERTKHFTEIALNEVVPSGMDCTDGGDKEHKLPEKAQIHSEFTNDLEAVQFITVKEMSAHTEDLISECPMGDQESDAKNLNMLGNASMGSEALLSHHNIDSLRSASQKQMRHHATKHSKPNKTSPGDDVLPIIPSTPKAQDVIQKYCTDDKQADEEPEDDNSMDMEAGDTTAKEGGESQELLQQWRNWLRMQSSVEGSPGRLADPSLLKHGFADGTRGAQLSDTPGLELRGGAADAASPGMHATTSRRTHGLQGAGRESWSSPPSADFFHRIPPDSGLDVPQLGSAEIPRDYNSKTMSLRGWGSILQDESELIATSDKPARPEWPSDWDSEALSLGPESRPADESAMLRTSLVGGLPDDQIAEMLGLKNLQAGLSDILDGTALINKLNADINEPFDGRDYPVGSHRHTESLTQRILRSEGLVSVHRGVRGPSPGFASAQLKGHSTSHGDVRSIDSFIRESTQWIDALWKRQNTLLVASRHQTLRPSLFEHSFSDTSKFSLNQECPRQFKMSAASRKLLQGRGCLSFEERNRQLLERKAAAVAARRDPEQDELAQCTFNPSLNHHSVKIVGRRSREDLMKWSKARNERVQQQKRDRIREAIKEDIGECTFSPQINPNSHQIAINKRNGNISVMTTDEINGMPRTVPVPEKKLSPKTAPSSQRDAKLIGSSGSFEIKSRRKEKSGLADSQKRFSNEWREELGKEVPKTPICMVDEIFSKIRGKQSLPIYWNGKASSGHYIDYFQT